MKKLPKTESVIILLSPLRKKERAETWLWADTGIRFQFGEWEHKNKKSRGWRLTVFSGMAKCNFLTIILKKDLEIT